MTQADGPSLRSCLSPEIQSPVSGPGYMSDVVPSLFTGGCFAGGSRSLAFSPILCLLDGDGLLRFLTPTRAKPPSGFIRIAELPTRFFISPHLARSLLALPSSVPRWRLPRPSPSLVLAFRVRLDSIPHPRPRTRPHRQSNFRLRWNGNSSNNLVHQQPVSSRLGTGRRDSRRHSACRTPRSKSLRGRHPWTARLPLRPLSTRNRTPSMSGHTSASSSDA